MITILKAERIISDRGALLNYSRGLILNHLYTERWGLFWPFVWPKDWWSFKLDSQHPAMYQDFERDGCFWQPNRKKTKTDLGSIPPPLRARFPATEFPFEYCTHDDAYGSGGLFRASDLSKPFEFVEIPRSEADRLLNNMIYTRLYRVKSRCVQLQEGWHREGIYRSVRLMGRFVYSPVKYVPKEVPHVSNR